MGGGLPKIQLVEFSVSIESTEYSESIEILFSVIKFTRNTGFL